MKNTEARLLNWQMLMALLRMYKGSPANWKVAYKQTHDSFTVPKSLARNEDGMYLIYNSTKRLVCVGIVIQK